MKSCGNCNISGSFNDLGEATVLVTPEPLAGVRQLQSVSQFLASQVSVLLGPLRAAPIDKDCLWLQDTQSMEEFMRGGQGVDRSTRRQKLCQSMRHTEYLVIAG